MVGAIGGVRSVFVSAVTGLRAATQSLAQNSAAIAHQSVMDYQDSARFSSAGRALAAKSQQSLATAPQPSLERSLVGQLVAKHDFAANVTSLRTADEVLQKLVHLGDGGR